MKVFTSLLLLVLITIISNDASAQFKLPKINIPTNGLTDKILNDDPPITTSLDDAVLSVPYLDDFEPKVFRQLSELERDSEGSFILEPGNFEFEAQSYCMHAGTYGPGKGAGYLQAPLKGKQADTITSILKNSLQHPEIEQQDVQVLIWAVISRTKISDMDRNMQSTAAKLLKPAQIYKLNGGALGLLPSDLKGKAFNRLPAPAKMILQAEAKLRSKLTDVSVDYSELERIAVLEGEPEKDEGNEIPFGRWSYDTEGFFVRFEPDGYPHTTVRLHIPEKYIIQRDSLGRIILISDTRGNRIETSYNDSAPVISISGDPGVEGYSFSLIKFVNINPETGETRTAEWKDTGWTFVGEINGKGTFKSSNSNKRKLPAFALAFTPYRIAEGFGEKIGDIKERYDNANKRKQQLKDYKDRLDKQNRERSEQDVDDLTDLEHYNDGLDKALSDDMGEKADWVDEHLNRVKNAWNYASCRLAGGCDPDEKEEKKPLKKKKFDPSKNSAVPANRGSQRLAISSRQFGK